MGTVGDRVKSRQKAARGETTTCLETGFFYAMAVSRLRWPSGDGGGPWVGPSKHVAQGEIHEKGRAPLGAAGRTRFYAYLVLRAYMLRFL